MKKLTIIMVITLVVCACNTAPRVKDEFTVDVKSPSVKIGEVEFQLNRTFSISGALKKVNAEVSYFPIEDAVCLQFKVDMITLQQFWSSEGREMFVKALEVYKKDFEARNFGNSNLKSKRLYGTTKGYIAWHTSRISVQAKASTDYTFGYYFVDRAPYFVAHQKATEYIDPNFKDNNRKSNEMSVYFTRAQADAIVALFDPDFLDTVTLARPVPVMPNTNIEVDEYYGVDKNNEVNENSEVDEYNEVDE